MMMRALRSRAAAASRLLSPRRGARFGAAAAPLGAVALLVAVAALAQRPAQAAISASCADLRNKIVAMESQVPSGAALSVDLATRNVYINDCLKHPSDGATPGSAASDPWFDAAGDPASGPPPEGDGLYQTTQEIAGYCRGSSEPQLCALMLNLGEGSMLTEGGDPKDPQDWVDPERDIDPADALPPLQLAAGGQTFPIDEACLGGLSATLFANPAGTGLRQRLAANMASPQCAGELSAINSALGPIQDAIAQWRAAALSDPTMQHDARGKMQPAFVAMCSQAFNNQNTCLKHQADMTTYGNDGSSSTQGGTQGQAGAFGECASLYGSVVAMCRQSGVQFQRSPLRPASAEPGSAGHPAKKLPPPQRGAAAPPKDTTGGSSAPPMDAKCQGLVKNLVTAAKANDGPGAKAGYDALQKAGGCGVVSASTPAPAAAPDPRFVSRGDTPMIDQTFGACDQQPERCNQLADQLKAGTSPAAIAALYANAIGVGLQLGAEMAQGLAAAQQMQMRVPSGGQTDMRSLAGPIIRNGVGQGAPTYRPPRNSNSDITGTH